MDNTTRLDTAKATSTPMPDSLCTHQRRCPSADSPDREAAHVVASHPEQGWSLLCNGVLLFEDTGELLPDGRIVTPHRPTDTVAGVLTMPRADVAALIGGVRGGKANVAAFTRQHRPLT